MIFLLVRGVLFRSHSCQVFHYDNGVWTEEDLISIDCLDQLTALEGLFIELSNINDLEWNWPVVLEAIETLLEEHDQQSGSLIKKYCH